MAKILLVDDDVEFADKLSRHLKTQGHIVDVANSGSDALQLCKTLTFELLILDWQMPELTGLQVCQKLRGMGKLYPIIFLTGLDDVTYKESGLDSGADDYMVKPVDLRELAARIRSVLRRPQNIKRSDLTAGQLGLDCTLQVISFGTKNLKITHREVALLEFLIRHPNQLFTSRELRDSVWPADGNASDEAVRTCIKTLRQKIKSIDCPELIKTVAGGGYTLEVE
ncbi:MAG: response regulator transcription factor [Candidatus Obscuribacterales bacterium]|jgi:OmpR-family two-component system manganese-sensing response regulator|nr:response regulator transcription factor [Candidatus Obscuribacterales bacterium]